MKQMLTLTSARIAYQRSDLHTVVPLEIPSQGARLRIRAFKLYHGFYDYSAFYVILLPKDKIGQEIHIDTSLRVQDASWTRLARFELTTLLYMILQSIWPPLR